MIYIIDHNDSFTHNVIHQFSKFDKVEYDNYDDVSQSKLKIADTIIFSPGPLIYKLRSLLKNFTTKDYLLLTGDPAIIGVACSIVSDMTNGKYNLLKWDKQERKYYPIEINLYERGEINDYWLWERSTRCNEKNW